MRAALAKGQITRFAIANPEHAPYGERAREALQHARLWQPLTGKLVLGENVSQALQFATVGGAQGGIVSYSLVLDPAFAARADYALLQALSVIASKNPPRGRQGGAKPGHHRTRRSRHRRNHHHLIHN